METVNIHLRCLVLSSIFDAIILWSLKPHRWCDGKSWGRPSVVGSAFGRSKAINL